MTSNTTHHNILIVGAGPSGLAIAARLRQAKIDYHIIEKSSRIGNSWFEHYDRLHLHTVKDYSELPFKPFPKEYPTYVSKFLLYDYYQEYAKDFEIKPEFNTAIVEVRRSGDHWLVNCQNDKAFSVNHLIIATGVNCIPVIPCWPGEEAYKGQIFHSRYFKSGGDYKGQKVLVVGMGNTGAEIALDLAEHGVDTSLSVRSPVNIVPRDIVGRPTQLTAIKLDKLPTWLSDWIGNQLQKVTIGNLSKYGLKTAKIPPAKQLREHNKTPIIDLGTVKMIKQGKIKIIGDIKEITPSGVLCSNGDNQDFDAIVLATGFKCSVLDYLPIMKDHMNSFDLPAKLIGKNELQGLYFIGFNSNLAGGILGVIVNDSKIITDHILTKMKVKSLALL